MGGLNHAFLRLRLAGREVRERLALSAALSRAWSLHFSASLDRMAKSEVSEQENGEWQTVNGVATMF